VTHSPTTSFAYNVFQLTDMVVQSRLATAIAERTQSYSIYRETRFAVRQNLTAFFDRLASESRWRAHRQRAGHLLLDGDSSFVAASGGHKTDYSSCTFAIWARSVAEAEEIIALLHALAGDSLITEPMFSIDWHFLDSKRELQSADIEEMADDKLLDAAYPELAGGVAAFIEGYLKADEAVLVLQGPPGTGKTRLIRAILGAMSRRIEGQASAIYTGDMKALESDEIFVKFITGWDEAFVVEDADHLLKPRSSGNEHLHRFLTVADGVVRSQGRKIIFSTNLPNVGDLDDALVRPGRCYARLNIRPLTRQEAERLLAELAAAAGIPPPELDAAHRSFTVAEIYKRVQAAGAKFAT